MFSSPDVHAKFGRQRSRLKELQWVKYASRHLFLLTFLGWWWSWTWTWAWAKLGFGGVGAGVGAGKSCSWEKVGLWIGAGAVVVELGHLQNLLSIPGFYIF